MTTKEYYEKYEELAQKIGVAYLIQAVPISAEEVNSCLNKGDNYFNSYTLLREWDRDDYWVRLGATRAGIKYWSLGQTVSLLKHVARYHVGNGVPPTE